MASIIEQKLSEFDFSLTLLIIYPIFISFFFTLIFNAGKECIIENLHIVIGVLTRLVSYPHLMVTSLELLES
jgi:hypothetical protein